ncbi:MAG: hypothetical protein ACYCU0_01825 [Solirubrobacteraceae bacterium]
MTGVVAFSGAPSLASAKSIKLSVIPSSGCKPYSATLEKTKLPPVSGG